MSEELEVLRTVAARLDQAGIAYMLTGSMALNYYAVPRMTRDIDLVVELEPGDAERFVRLFQSDFYVELEAVRRGIVERGIFNLIHDVFVIKVDCVVRKETEYRREEFARRTRVGIEGQAVSIVTPEDLVISKLDWARDTHSEIQLGDVRSLLASVQGLDEAYLGRWTDRLGLAALYEEVRR